MVQRTSARSPSVLFVCRANWSVCFKDRSMKMTPRRSAIRRYPQLSRASRVGDFSKCPSSCPERRTSQGYWRRPSLPPQQVPQTAHELSLDVRNLFEL
jgi:hypothetical protein